MIVKAVLSSPQYSPQLNFPLSVFNSFCKHWLLQSKNVNSMRWFHPIYPLCIPGQGSLAFLPNVEKELFSQTLFADGKTKILSGNGRTDFLGLTNEWTGFAPFWIIDAKKSEKPWRERLLGKALSLKINFGFIVFFRAAFSSRFSCRDENALFSAQIGSFSPFPGITISHFSPHTKFIKTHENYDQIQHLP